MLTFNALIDDTKFIKDINEHNINVIMRKKINTRRISEIPIWRGYISYKKHIYEGNKK